MVLDEVVRTAERRLPAGQQLGDVRPLVRVLLVRLEHDLLFGLGPRIFVDVRIQMVVPPFAALLTRARLQAALRLHLLRHH